ncbi:AMP-binding protein [Malikia sp.]|uniref:AMP-binding protein n=1 Tax=Malikia sp. TaxID=2070706 RepID=UPI0026100E97|nr:AMP-binding protein [Malikia sp.]MDD2729992.1 AMP-binding protein [Malikia sp.]
MVITAADRPWLAHYPPGMPADIDPGQYRSLVELLEHSFARHADRTACSFMGCDFSYAELDRHSRALAACLQGLGLRRGERIAVMLPNLPQYPVAVAAILRAGCVLVNVNPLYTPRELEQQLRDSGASAIVVLENFAATLQACLARTGVRHVLLCAVGDMLGPFKGALVDFMLRHVRQRVPPYQLPRALRFQDALARGRRLPLNQPELGPDDPALLQYTGGTTGVPKGALLLHRNLIANVLQSGAWNAPALRRLPPGEPVCYVCALPLHHIFAFTVCMLLCLHDGGRFVLIPDPRDLRSMIRTLARQRIHIFPGVDTLFRALLDHPDFGQVDWSQLLVSVGGGMTVQAEVARRWLERTGCPICEGYGLSEASPTVSCNPVVGGAFDGSIGLPLPGTQMMCIDEAGAEVAPGQPGEIAVRGPQVMAGYWQRPDETARVMLPGGWLRTGDIGIMDEGGGFRLVDRKKDLILVSGFKVYPSEVESVVAELPGVLDCAAVGLPDPRSGELVGLFVIRRDPRLDEHQIRDHCRTRLTGYKRPRRIEFRDALPRNPLGKVLRRALRDAELERSRTSQGQ